jgi:hypothetical protein
MAGLAAPRFTTPLILLRREVSPDPESTSPYVTQEGRLHLFDCFVQQLRLWGLLKVDSRAFSSLIGVDGSRPTHFSPSCAL